MGYYTKILGLVILILALISFSLFFLKRHPEEYFSYEDIPYVFVQKDLIEPGMTFQIYLSAFHSEMKAGWINYTSEQLQNKISEENESKRQAQIEKLVPMDYNRDGNINLEEAAKYIEEKNNQKFSTVPHKQRQENFKNWAKSFIAPYDTNKNGVISYQEMTTLSAETVSRRLPLHKDRNYSELKDLLWLDPTEDGVFSLEDMLVLAKKVYNTIDLDRDDTISTEEYNQYKRSVGNGPRQNHYVTSDCRFENTSFPEDLRVYAVSSGLSAPPKNVRGRVKTIRTISIQEDGPVALILTSRFSTGLEWHIERAQNTELYAVIVNGVDPEHVKGLDKKTKTVFGKLRASEAGCYMGDFELNPLSRQFFNKSVDLVFQKPRGNTYYIPLPNHIEDNQSVTEIALTEDEISDLHEKTYSLKIAVPHLPELMELIKNKTVRFSTEEDLIALKKANARKIKELDRDKPAVAGESIVDRVPSVIKEVQGGIYVIMKEFECTDDFIGEDAFLLLDKGVPFPKINWWCREYTIFDLDDGSCISPLNTGEIYRDMWGCEIWEENYPDIGIMAPSWEKENTEDNE